MTGIFGGDTLDAIDAVRALIAAHPRDGGSRMTPTETVSRLRRLADDWRKEEKQLCEQFGSEIVPRSMRARRIKDTKTLEAAIELIERLELAESSVVWHRRRWMALQMHQSKMREPERTMVCDILAHGELMHPTVSGDRYATKDAMEKSK